MKKHSQYGMEDAGTRAAASSLLSVPGTMVMRAEKDSSALMKLSSEGGR